MATLHTFDDNSKYTLELHFTLNSPTVIKRVRVPPYDPENKTPMDLRTRLGDRYTAWNPRDHHLVREINDSPVFHMMIFDLDVSLTVHRYSTELEL